eukprot:5008698-Pyramimonas_sp.AAC.1
MGSSTEGPSGRVHMRLPAHRMSFLGHPLHVSWPYSELHRRPQWQAPHAAPHPLYVIFGAPLTSFVVQQGARSNE